MINKQDILNMVSQYMIEKWKNKKWTPGVDWVQYAGPYFSDDEFVRAVSTLLDEWVVLGEDAAEFEKVFPRFLGQPNGIVTNSGSSANLLMMLTAKKIFDFKRSENVIIPIAGFPTTLNPILQCGLTPTFVDIELDTLNLDLDQVGTAMKGNRRNILTFAHVLGNPPNMDRLRAIKGINGENLILLEDCCDALGSTYNGIPLGSYGEISTCSFYPAHHMTMGEGGFLACRTEYCERVARQFRDWGRGCHCIGKKAGLSTKGMCGRRFDKWLPNLPNEIFDHKYVYEQIGYNLKPIELQCSIGLAQIQKLPQIHILRKENHKRLTQIFTPYEEFFHIHKATPKSDPSWFAFPITVRDGAPFKRSDFTTYLEDNKIQTRNYFGGNLMLQPAYKDVVWGDCRGWIHVAGGNDQDTKTRFPVATKVTTDTLFLGTSPVISKEQLGYVEEKVKGFFEKI